MTLHLFVSILIVAVMLGCLIFVALLSRSNPPKSAMSGSVGALLLSLFVGMMWFNRWDGISADLWYGTAVFLLFVSVVFLVVAVVQAAKERKHTTTTRTRTEYHE